eukprot:TRINITY_DN9733_c0_g1_i1.p1 TRINITY_DN9733_c0_g1~~TRINITY_DN9733_c0_g1_i1.p1  ORF type:complete len:322 (+),score=63.96 TRINITY_DN9733_c0_g1_i1:211-1176(+)
MLRSLQRQCSVLRITEERFMSRCCGTPRGLFTGVKATGNLTPTLISSSSSPSTTPLTSLLSSMGGINSRHLSTNATITTLNSRMYTQLNTQTKNGDDAIVRVPCAGFATGGANGEAVAVADSEDEPVLLYTAPFGVILKRLKWLSLSGCVAGTFGFPILAVLAPSSAPLVAKIVLTASMMAASIGTTALLQYVVKGYVVDLHYQPSTERVSWTVYSLFAQKRTIEAPLSETAPPLWSPHPLVTFSYNNKNYYVHTNAFEDKEFLAALVKDPSVTSATEGDTTSESTSTTTAPSSSSPPSPSTATTTSAPSPLTSDSQPSHQ